MEEIRFIDWYEYRFTHTPDIPSREICLKQSLDWLEYADKFHNDHPKEFCDYKRCLDNFAILAVRDFFIELKNENEKLKKKLEKANKEISVYDITCYSDPWVYNQYKENYLKEFGKPYSCDDSDEDNNDDSDEDNKE